MEARLQCNWSDQKCMHNSICDCDMNVLVPVLNFRFTVSRWKGGVRRDNSTMHLLAMSKISSNFRMENGMISRVDLSQPSIYIKLRMALLPMANMVTLPPYFPRNLSPKEEGTFFPHEFIGRIMRDWDERFFKAFMLKSVPREFLDRDVFQVSSYSTLPGHQKDIDIPTLQVLAARRCSSYNLAFGGYERDPRAFPYVRSALSNMYPHKFVDMISNYGTKTRFANQFAESLAPLLPEALDTLYHAMDTKKEFGKYAWVESLECLDDVRGDTSSGIDAPPTDGRRTTFQFAGSDVWYRASVNGKKFELFDRGKEMLKTYIIQAREKRIEMLAKAFTLKAKNEWFAKYDAYTSEEYSRYASKFRFFNIGYLDTQFTERYLFSPRQKIERGGVIQIGHRWWYGGADRLVRMLIGKVLGDGDLANCDQTMHRVLLELFFATAHVYFNFVGDQKIRYKRMVSGLAEVLTNRITNLFGDEWKVIFGGVASGVFSTSHADSWIVALMFYLFVIYTSRQVSLEVRKKISLLLVLRKLLIIVYGDDHVIGVDDKNEYADVRKVINEGAFAAWAMKFFDVNIKDIHNDISLETIPGSGGGVLYRGVVFLKRYFIKRNWKMFNGPEYVPYRPIHHYPQKIVFGKEAKDRSLHDVMLSCIGNAYDTYGANPSAYALNKYVFERIRNALGMRGLPAETLMSRIMRNKVPADIIAFQRKGAMTVEELWKGFPKLAELRVRHAVDRKYTDNLMEDITGQLVFE